jgi:hypothetical protein
LVGYATENVVLFDQCPHLVGHLRRTPRVVGAVVLNAPASHPLRDLNLRETAALGYDVSLRDWFERFLHRVRNDYLTFLIIHEIPDTNVMAFAPDGHKVVAIKAESRRIASMLKHVWSIFWMDPKHVI